MVDRDVGAGQELPLLVWVAIHGVVQEIGADAAVVQQGVALCRARRSRRPLFLALGSIRKSSSLRLVSLTCSPNRR